MVRHHQRVGAELDRHLGVLDVENAFQHQLARPDRLDPRDVLPVQRRIELLRGPLRQLGDALHAFDVADQVAEALALALQDAPGPGRLAGDVDDVLDAELRRHRHAVLDVAVALAEHLQVDRKHQRVAFGGVRAREQVLGELAVLDDVKLEPERFAGRLRHILDRADRHGRQRERNAGFVGGLRAQDFAVAVLHAAQADRRQHDRRRRRLADDGGGEAALRHVHQDALAKLDVHQVAAVGVIGLLVIGAGIDVIVESARNLAAGAHAQVLDAGGSLHGDNSGKCVASHPSGTTKRAT